jgi:hypothetical protein
LHSRHARPPLPAAVVEFDLDQQRAFAIHLHLPRYGDCVECCTAMPRYFFTIHRQDRVEDDRDGTYLPDAEAALSYADYTIRELRKKSGYKDDLSLAMIVEDQARQTVLSLPFFPGC